MYIYIYLDSLEAGAFGGPGREIPVPGPLEPPRRLLETTLFFDPPLGPSKLRFCRFGGPEKWCFGGPFRTPGDLLFSIPLLYGIHFFASWLPFRKAFKTGSLLGTSKSEDFPSKLEFWGLQKIVVFLPRSLPDAPRPLLGTRLVPFSFSTGCMSLRMSLLAPQKHQT